MRYIVILHLLYIFALLMNIKSLICQITMHYRRRHGQVLRRHFDGINSQALCTQVTWTKSHLHDTEYAVWLGVFVCLIPKIKLVGK